MAGLMAVGFVITVMVVCLLLAWVWVVFIQRR